MDVQRRNQVRNNQEVRNLNTKSEKQQPIGVMDSGLGGLTVLREIIKLMPNEDYVYFGDSANAPYGTRTPEDVYRLTKVVVDMFINKYNVKAIVIACNTATSAAAARLRKEYDLPIIGLEPAIKPAAIDYPNGKIIAMATELTLAGTKFENRIHELGLNVQIIKVPAPDLVEYVEHGELDSIAVKNYLHQILDDKLPADAIVLGCTHFPFVQKTIQEVAGKDVVIYDGSNGAARQLKRQLKAINKLTTVPTQGTVSLNNSDPTQLKLMEKLLAK